MLAGAVGWPEETAARYRREGSWLGLTLGDALHGWATVHGDSVALTAGDRRFSYRQLDAAVDQMATELIALGIQPRDRVLLHLPNVPEFLVLAFALFRIDALPVFALPAHRELEINDLCDLSGAVAYAAPASMGRFDSLGLARRMRDRHARLQHLLILGAPETETDLFHLTISTRGPAAEGLQREPDPADVAFFLLSGGTTGTPKLIPRTHDDYVYNYRQASRVCEFDADTVYLVTLPVAHNFPFGCPGALGTFEAGGHVVLSTDPSPASAFATIAEYRVTATALVPTLVIRWLDAPERADFDLTSLRTLQVGGARLNPEIAQRVEPTLGCRLQQVFGMAEGLLNYTRLDDADEEVIVSQGRPMSPADEIRIVDEEDRDVPAGTPGELLTRGPYTIRGYYRAEEHNAVAFTSDGFYRTGDTVRRLPSGNLIVEGRTKDLINRGGEKISAEEIENLILGHADVRNVAAVAMPDPSFGERTCAFVVLRDGATLRLEDLVGYLRGTGVASFKLPERLECIDDLPLTSVGKVNKKKLREKIAATLDSERTDANQQGGPA